MSKVFVMQIDFKASSLTMSIPMAKTEFLMPTMVGNGCYEDLKFNSIQNLRLGFEIQTYSFLIK